MAGFFFSYSVSVMLGLKKMSSLDFIVTMKNINREIQNFLFLLCFFGSLSGLFVSSFVFRNSEVSVYVFSGLFCYFIGAFLVTVIFNVPLNSRLETFDINAATNMTVEEMRADFEKKWNFWNNVRTFSSFLALLCLILACIKLK